MISDGSEIGGTLEFSVIFGGVTIEEGATVTDSIIMPGAIIKSGATVQYAIIAENTVIEEGAVVGERPENVCDKDQWGVAVVGADLTIGKGVKVAAKEMIECSIPSKEEQ
jgi:glucose-1-phosphate adenylyltransferase